MNVYDFDGTVYEGDSTVDFFLYSLKKRPTLLRYLPRQAWGALRYLCKRTGKTGLKEYFFSFLRGIDARGFAEEFWKKHGGKISIWYLAKQKPDDIVISASPAFLLQPICSRMGIRSLIASEVDPETGLFTGKNCRGEEKVHRFAAQYPNAKIDEFYSDSRSDLPLAKLAGTAYLVRRGVLKPWKGEDAHANKGQSA